MLPMKATREGQIVTKKSVRGNFKIPAAAVRIAKENNTGQHRGKIIRRIRGGIRYGGRTGVQNKEPGIGQAIQIGEWKETITGAT